MKRTKLPTDPAAQLRALIERTCKPGLAIIMFAHDDWCPAADSQRGEDCICEPDVYLCEEIDPKANAT